MNKTNKININNINFLKIIIKLLQNNKNSKMNLTYLILKIIITHISIKTKMVKLKLNNFIINYFKIYNI